MSRILRGTDATSLAQPFAAHCNKQLPISDAENENIALAGRVRELERELAQNRALHEDEVREARLAGEATGRQGAERRAEVLSEALAQAQKTFSARLQNLDTLAVAITRTALGIVFHDVDARADQVLSALKLWLERQERTAAVEIRLSSTDVATIGTEALSASLGDAADRIAVDRSLASGDCVIEARFGTVDVAPLRQWKLLDEAFQTMLAEGI